VDGFAQGFNEVIVPAFRGTSRNGFGQAVSFVGGVHRTFVRLGPLVHQFYMQNDMNMPGGQLWYGAAAGAALGAAGMIIIGSNRRQRIRHGESATAQVTVDIIEAEPEARDGAIARDGTVEVLTLQLHDDHEGVQEPDEQEYNDKTGVLDGDDFFACESAMAKADNGVSSPQQPDEDDKSNNEDDANSWQPPLGSSDEYDMENDLNQSIYDGIDLTTSSQPTDEACSPASSSSQRIAAATLALMKHSTSSSGAADDESTSGCSDTTPKRKPSKREASGSAATPQQHGSKVKKARKQKTNTENILSCDFDETMICPKCGEELKVQCHHCGYEMFLQ